MTAKDKHVSKFGCIAQTELELETIQYACKIAGIECVPNNSHTNAIYAWYGKLYEGEDNNEMGVMFATRPSPNDKDLKFIPVVDFCKKLTMSEVDAYRLEEVNDQAPITIHDVEAEFKRSGAKGMDLGDWIRDDYLKLRSELNEFKQSLREIPTEKFGEGNGMKVEWKNTLLLRFAELDRPKSWS